jgi:hypothetical protein
MVVAFLPGSAGDNRRDDLALLVVARRIHRDEAFLSELQRDTFKRNAPNAASEE